MAYKIPLFNLNFDEKEAQAAYDTIKSGWISTGPKNAELEQMFVDMWGVKYAVSMSNCTDALHHVDTVEPRESEVEEHRIGKPHFDRGQALGARRRPGDRMRFAFECYCDGARDEGVVFNEENMHGVGGRESLGSRFRGAVRAPPVCGALSNRLGISISTRSGTEFRVTFLGTAPAKARPARRTAARASCSEIRLSSVVNRAA